VRPPTPTKDTTLLRLTELEVATRSANALASRIKSADFPALKDLDTYDFSVMPSVSKQKILELSRGGWIDEKTNACFIGNAGTGKTHLSVALGQAACRAGKRVRFCTAATLVNQLEESQKILSRQCLNRRIPDEPILRRELDAWNIQRCREASTVNWQFTTADARIKLHRLYPPF
jgi:DNA replication protein DnaC